MRRHRRHRWQDEEEDETPHRRQHERLDVNRMVMKMLPWALILGVLMFFLEQWLKG